MTVRAIGLRLCGAAGLSLWLSACAPPTPGGGQAPDPGTSGEARPASFDAGPVRPAHEYLEEPRFAGADLKRGELLGLACLACHTLAAGEGTLVGPNLHGVFGRPAASLPGFEFSPALTASGLVWTPISLEAWLADPSGFVAGTT
ncbi:MAG TPA: cytochrome c family protein, partial [Gammaproteobacteria bacterium]